VLALEKLAGDLADQRLRLAEEWERLAQTQLTWHTERNLTAAELRSLAGSLQQKAQAILGREQDLEAGTIELRQRHHELMQLRQHLVGWEARLRARELTWEADRERALTDLRNREELAERHLSAVVDLRQRWAKRRRRELELIQGERAACEKVRHQYVTLREERRRRSWELEEERSRLTAKALAIEQHQRECLSRGGDAPAAERRIERLRRRWLTDHAASLRTLKSDRDAFQAEAERLEEQHRELQKRSNKLEAEQAALGERETAWEHKQTVLEVEHSRLRQELQAVQAHRDRAVLQVKELQGEVERIARQLLDEPEAPPMLQERAAA
jgi:hypothetical protein